MTAATARPLGDMRSQRPMSVIPDIVQLSYGRLHREAPAAHGEEAAASFEIVGRPIHAAMVLAPDGVVRARLGEGARRGGSPLAVSAPR